MDPATIVLAAICAVLFWLRERDHRQEIKTIHGLLELHDEQQQRWQHQLNALAADANARDPHPDLTALIALTERLCQRIQAPEQAVVDHALAQPLPPVPPTVTPNTSDEDYWKAMEAFNVSKDELAHAAMSQELDGS